MGLISHLETLRTGVQDDIVSSSTVRRNFVVFM